MKNANKKLICNGAEGIHFLKIRRSTKRVKIFFFKLNGKCNNCNWLIQLQTTVNLIASFFVHEI